MTSDGERTIQVEYLARVEGEGALHVTIVGGRVTDVALKIFEPPRLFEALLRGRRMTEAPDITARICGICPVAYQMSAVHAIEDACGVTVGGQLRALRRLLYCGEWIESHALHVYMLHAPDFLGVANVIEIARRDPAMVERGLQLKRAGNDIITRLGGREIHPINVRVGGFYRVPTRAELRPLAERLAVARELALDTVRWVAGFEFPDYTREPEYVALRHPTEYPMCEGRIVSTAGLDIAAREFDLHFVEEHAARSNALHCRLRARGAYQVGPLARFRLNYDRLSPLAQQAARDAGIGDGCSNPFRSIVVRAVEIVYACDEALRVIAEYEPPEIAAIDVPPRDAIGFGCTEAPRGLLHHAYQVAADGTLRKATIVPPTSQNQLAIEDDLRAFIADRVELPDDRLRWQCEQAIRNYDPCISCATHFLALTVDRS